MSKTILDLTAQIVTSYAGNNELAENQLPELVKLVYQALATVATSPAGPSPAVEVRKSIRSDRIVCLACGASFSLLKRHLRTEHQLTPAAYRGRYSLPPSYPLVAPDYARTRSTLAKQIGLGRKSGESPRMRRSSRRGG